MDFIVSIISSASVSSLLAIAVVWLSRNWLSERLKRSIEHEYAQKLVAHKSILKAENDVALERLRASISQNQSIQSVATSTFTAINIASHDRKIKAVCLTLILLLNTIFKYILTTDDTIYTHE